MQKLLTDAKKKICWQTWLISLTLVTSAVHFADDAFHLDMYPGPPWLTRNVVLATWLVLPATAGLAYRLKTRWVSVGYGLLGFAGLAHFFVPHGTSFPFRCTATIAAEVFASTLWIAYALFRSGVVHPC